MQNFSTSMCAKIMDIFCLCLFLHVLLTKTWIPPIADVAVMKRYQQLDEIRIFTRTSKKSAKLFTSKLCQAYAVWHLHTHLQVHADHTQLRQVSQAYCMTEISCKQLCWFPGCSGGKKIKILFSRWWCLELATSPIGAPCLTTPLHGAVYNKRSRIFLLYLCCNHSITKWP